MPNRIYDVPAGVAKRAHIDAKRYAEMHGGSMAPFADTATKVHRVPALHHVGAIR